MESNHQQFPFPKWNSCSFVTRFSLARCDVQRLSLLCRSVILTQQDSRKNSVGASAPSCSSLSSRTNCPLCSSVMLAQIVWNGMLGTITIFSNPNMSDHHRRDIKVATSLDQAPSIHCHLPGLGAQLCCLSLKCLHGHALPTLCLHQRRLGAS